MKKLIFSILIALLLWGVGCVGSPVHSTIAYGSVKKTIRKNNTAILTLKAGMSQDEVKVTLGNPERSEGYPWGSAWLYRTAISQGIDGGIYGTIDADFTPLMFDEKGTLHGWGRNYFEQYVNKYEVTLKHQSGTPK